MRLGISTSSFFNRINTESAFDIIRQMHIDTAEVYLTTFSEYEQRFLDALVPRKGNLNVYSVHPEGAQFEPELFSTNSRVRADAELFFKKVCAAARALGAKYYTFHGPVRLKKTSYEFDFVRLGDRVNQLSEIARSFGISLAYENVFYGYGNNPDYFRDLLRQCPNLACSLNVKNALLAHIDPIIFLDAMQGRIAIIYLCDVCKDMSTALPGEGKYNFEKFFSELYKRNIVNTCMIIEANSRDYRDLNQLKAAYDYLAALWIKTRN